VAGVEAFVVFDPGYVAEFVRTEQVAEAMRVSEAIHCGIAPQTSTDDDYARWIIAK
jgi:hypothetical protein